MRNTWWVTRPKRYLGSVPRALTAIASISIGIPWSTPDKAVPLAIEDALETSGLKRKGTRRDRAGSGARTYRSWLKSLGLLFMDNQDQLQLTLAGEDLINGDHPYPSSNDKSSTSNTHQPGHPPEPQPSTPASASTPSTSSYAYSTTNA